MSVRDLKQAVVDQILGQSSTNLLLELRISLQKLGQCAHKTVQKTILVVGPKLFNRSLNDVSW